MQSGLALITVQTHLVRHVLTPQVRLVSRFVISGVVTLDGHDPIGLLLALHLLLRSFSIHYQLLLPGRRDSTDRSLPRYVRIVNVCKFVIILVVNLKYLLIPFPGRHLYPSLLHLVDLVLVLTATVRADN